MNPALWIITTYLVVIISIGWVLGRRKGGVHEFFVAGGEISWLLLVPFLMAEYVTAVSTIGASEMAHSYGVTMLWYFVGAPLGLSLLAFTLAKFYIKARKITIGEVIADLFDQKNRILFTLFILITSAVNCTSAFLGLGTILSPILHISYESGVWLSAAVMVLIAIIGLRGIAVMNFVHLFTIFICFGIAAITSLNVVGGPAVLIASLPSEHLNFSRLGWPTVLAWVISSTSVKLISLVAVTAMFAARDLKTAKLAAVLTGFWVMIFALFPMIIGLAAYVLMPDIPSRLVLWQMGEICGTAVSILLSVGVIAAIISTTPAILLGLGGIATRDFFLFIKPNASDKTQIAFSKIIIPCFVLISTIYALAQPTIMGMIIGMQQIRVIFVVVIMISVLYKRIHPNAAFITTSIGGVTSLVWFFIGSPYGIEPMWIALGFGIPILFVTSIFYKPSKNKGTPDRIKTY